MTEKTTVTADEKTVTETSFHTLVQGFYKPIFSYVYSKIKHREATEDIVQEIWIRAYESLKTRDIKSEQFLGWLYGIAQNCCREWWRKRTRTDSANKKLASIPIKEADPTLKEKKLMSVLEAIHELPEEPRTVLSMKYLNQMSCAEIAQALNKPVGTIKSILSRAYDSVREILNAKFKEVEL